MSAPAPTTGIRSAFAVGSDLDVGAGIGAWACVGPVGARRCVDRAVGAADHRGDVVVAVLEVAVDDVVVRTGR